MTIETVHAVTLEGTRSIALRSYPFPHQLEDGTALVRMEFSGICGTDKHSYKGEIYQYGGRPLPLPVIPGHENVGVIAGIEGEVLDQDGVPFAVGDRVVVAANLPCGRCHACRNGHPYYACVEKLDYGNNISAKDAPHLFGGWSEYLYVARTALLFRFPDTLPPELGVLVEPMAVTGCLDKAKSWASDWEPFRAADTVVILGVGPIGICHLIKARFLGAGRVIAVDPSQYRLDLARAFGADNTVRSADREDTRAAVLGMTHGRGADLVVDCTGIAAGFRTGLDLIREGGLLIEVGTFVDGGEVAVNPHKDILAKNARIMGVAGDDLAAYATSIKLMEATLDRFPWQKLITHRFSLAEAEAAMTQALGPDSGKVVFEPQRRI
ncbi:MAG TPA: zinc-binding dehydrogenase [Bauldia sp.]|nr:zinc-binding dehydrogenase [Bauldia sp.]